MDAASFSVDGKKRLLALVQSQDGQGQELEGETEAIGAQEARIGIRAQSADRSHSSGILDVLEDLKDKAQAELSELRKTEMADAHNFNMLKQSLEDQIANDTKDLDDEKATKAAAEGEKAEDEGDLAETVKDLAAGEAALDTAQSTCMSVAADHEATLKGRAEELAAVAKATEILESTSSGAVAETYSFLQEATAMRLRTKE